MSWVLTVIILILVVLIVAIWPDDKVGPTKFGPEDLL
jgi:hypothetical protein